MAPKIVVAIDLGTSRSAWAYSIEGRAQNDIIIRVPEGSRASVSAMKTETAILLGTEGREFVAFGRAARERFIEDTEQDEEEAYGGSGEIKSGRPSAASSMLFSFFKVGLCESKGYTSVNEPVATAHGRQRVPLLDVMAAVLRHFKEDALAHLSSVSEISHGVDDIAWVITIPAIYDEFAKRFMRVAAYEAGITKSIDSSSLRLCLEPEAACLAVITKEAPCLCPTGDKVMILDCGGGTVDITMHEITAIGPLRLKELLPPTGGPWGSAFVDKEFIAWCREFLGDENFTRVQHTSTYYALLIQWEEGKTSFSGGKDERVRLNMVDISQHLGINVARMQELREGFNDNHAASPGLHVKGGKLVVVLPCDLVKKFFQPTLTRIASRLRQLKHDLALRDLKHVFLVGGFASSPLLQKVARSELDGGGCSVVGALRPDVAIVGGAVLFANDATAFSSRKARLTYGVIASTRYNGTDPEHVRRRQPSRVYDENRNEQIDCFSTHVLVGDDISQDGACELHNYSPISRDQRSVMFRILASHRKDIKFPDPEVTFPVGHVSVPVDMTARFEDRVVQVQFVFGGTEFQVKCFCKRRGKIGNATLSLVQEVLQQNG